MTWLTNDRGCGKCSHCGMDMDMDPFCVQPEVLAKVSAETGRTYEFGLNINSARERCKGDSWEQHPKRVGWS